MIFIDLFRDKGGKAFVVELLDAETLRVEFARRMKDLPPEKRSYVAPKLGSNPIWIVTPATIWEVFQIVSDLRMEFRVVDRAQREIERMQKRRAGAKRGRGSHRTQQHPPPWTNAGTWSTPTDPDFAVLHLLPSAPQEVAQAAYRALAVLTHPDKGGSDEAMKKVNAAWGEVKKKRGWN